MQFFIASAFVCGVFMYKFIKNQYIDCTIKRKAHEEKLSQFDFRMVIKSNRTQIPERYLPKEFEFITHFISTLSVVPMQIYARTYTCSSHFIGWFGGKLHWIKPSGILFFALSFSMRLQFIWPTVVVAPSHPTLFLHYYCTIFKQKIHSWVPTKAFTVLILVFFDSLCLLRW